MKVFDSIQRWVLLCIAALIPVVFLPLTPEFFATPKVYLLLFGSLVACALIALQVLATRKVYSVYTPFTRILLVLFIVLLVSLLFASANPIQALYAIPSGLIVLGSLILFYLVTTYTAGVQRENIPIMEALYYGSLVTCVIVIIFYFKPLATLNLPQQWAFLQNQFSPVGNGLETLVLIGFTAALSLGYLIQALMRRKNNHSIQALAMTGIAVIAGVMVFMVVLKPINGRPQLQLPPLSLSWNAALETLKSPRIAITGVGLDSFDTAFTQVKPASYNMTPFWNVNFTLARSMLLHIWVETGVLGLLAFLLLGVYAIRELHGLRQAKDKDYIVYLLGGLFVGGMALLLPPSFIGYTIIIVYLIALAQKGLQAEKEPVHEFDLKKLPLVYVGLALIMLILVGAVGYYACRAYVAEFYFKKSIDAIRANDGRDVYGNLQTAIRMQPKIERYRAQFAQVNLLLANNIARKAQPPEEPVPEGEKPPTLTDQERQAVAQFVQQSISEGKALVALNPLRASNWNTLAVIYRNIINVADGAQAWTIAAYQEALRRDPNNPQLHLNLGGVYYGQKNYDLAIQHFQRAVALRPNWANAHYNLAWAFYQNKKPQEAVAVMRNVLQLIPKSSKDYSLAQENLTLFETDAEKATDSATVKPVEPPTEPDVQPLELPATPEAVISPGLKLPEGSGPEAGQ
jgi:tetratricopeptide (TPR) repeat protein